MSLFYDLDLFPFFVFPILLFLVSSPATNGSTSPLILKEEVHFLYFFTGQLFLSPEVDRHLGRPLPLFLRGESYFPFESKVSSLQGFPPLSLYSSCVFVFFPPVIRRDGFLRGGHRGWCLTLYFASCLPFCRRDFSYLHLARLPSAFSPPIGGMNGLPLFFSHPNFLVHTSLTPLFFIRSSIPPVAPHFLLAEAFLM